MCLYADVIWNLARSPEVAPFIIRAFSNPEGHVRNHVYGSDAQKSRPTRPKDTFFHSYDDPAKFIAENFDKIKAHKQAVISGTGTNVLHLAASLWMTHIDKISNGGGTVPTRQVTIVFEKGTGDVKTIYPN